MNPEMVAHMMVFRAEQELRNAKIARQRPPPRPRARRLGGADRAGWPR